MADATDSDPPQTVLSTTTVDTEYGSVRVADRPPISPGAPTSSAPLVFVHGYPDNLQIWTKVIQQFPERRCIAFDWPGLGHSQTYAGGATPFHLGRHLIALLDALGVDRAIPVGFDMGAHAVVSAAARSPERIEQLILTNFLADGTVKTSWDIAVMRRLGLNQVILRRAPKIVLRRAHQTFLTNQKLTQPIRDDISSAFMRTEVRDHLCRMCAGYQAALPRVTALYPELDIPTLVVWADQDSHFPLAQAHALTAALPNASLEVLEGASHWFMWERAEDFASVVRGHWRS